MSIGQEEILKAYKIKEKRLEYCKEYNINPRKIMTISRELITKKRVNNTLDTNKMRSWNKDDLNVAIVTLKFMFEEIYGLSPEQVDALWKDNKEDERKFLDTTVTKSLVLKIISESPKEVLKDCLFNNKKIILKTLYPEYYNHTYCSKYDVLVDVINASPTTIRDLRAAGRFKATIKGNKHNNNGTLVDEIIKEGIEVNFDIREKIRSYPDKLLFLAQSKQNHFKDLGLMRLIEARGCYASALDFYYLNSPEELQKEYFYDYIKLRNQYQRKDDVSNIINQVVNNVDELCLY